MSEDRGSPLSNSTALHGEPSVRALLKSATHRQHDALDAQVTAHPIDSEAGYRTFLRMSAAALIPLEQALAAAEVARILPDWAERARSAALQADLADLGVNDVPLITPPPLGGEAFLFGVLYVLEGSRLGAKFLARQALSSADARVRAATRYLRHGDGQNFWAGFLARLEASPDVRRTPAEAVAGAHAAFAHFESAATTIMSVAKLPRDEVFDAR